MLVSSDNQQTENPIEDTKSAVKATQKTVQTAKWGIRAVKLARSFNPVGATLLLKDLARKIPLVGKLTQDINKLIKKLAAGATVAGLYLLMLLAAKLASIIIGAVAGAAIGFLVGGPVGAVVGGAVGAAFGPQIVSAIGNYTGLAKSATSAIGHGATSIVSGIGNAISGAFSSVGSFLSGAVGSTFGTLGAAANFLTSLGGLSLPTSIVTVPLAVGIGGLGIGSIFITAFISPAAFFTLSSDSGEGELGTPGQNDYFTLTKTAFPNTIANQSLGATQQVEFTITLTAKSTRLVSVELIDEAKGGPNGTISIPTPPISCTVPIEPDTSCTQTMILGIDSKFNDSTVSNNVVANVIPEGQSLQTLSVTTTVKVGSPSAKCPTGWPSTGEVTQGPEGTTSHGPLGLEALDIGTDVGTPIVATVDGVVIYHEGPSVRGVLNQLIDVQPNSCPGLDVVRYQHLSAINVKDGDNIRFGQIIGASGNAGSGPHMHYQFNRLNQRGFRMEVPNIPQAVPRICDGNCNVTINSAP